MGALYDVNIVAMIAVSVGAQLLALPLYYLSDKKPKHVNSGVTFRAHPFSSEPCRQTLLPHQRIHERIWVIRCIVPNETLVLPQSAEYAGRDGGAARNALCAMDDQCVNLRP